MASSGTNTANCTIVSSCEGEVVGLCEVAAHNGDTTTTTHVRHVVGLHGCDIEDKLKGGVHKGVQSGHDVVQHLGCKARFVSKEIVQHQIEHRPACLGSATL